MLAVTKVLLDDPLPPLEETVAADRSTAKTISDVRRTHAAYWKCFDSGKTLVTRAPRAPRRTSIATTHTTQGKRKRKNSDGEYVPHLKAENDSSTSTARRTSKRLATTFTRYEELSSSTSSSTHSSRINLVTKRSSSSTSAPTSTSSSSLEPPVNPDWIFSLDLAPPPLPETTIWHSSDSDSSDTDSPPQTGTRTVTSLKIGPPPKEKKIVQDRNHARLILVGTKIPLPHAWGTFFCTLYDR